jgi:hypothetical protein
MTPPITREGIEASSVMSHHPPRMVSGHLPLIVHKWERSIERICQMWSVPNWPIRHQYRHFRTGAPMARSVSLSCLPRQTILLFQTGGRWRVRTEPRRAAAQRLGHNNLY